MIRWDAGPRAGAQCSGETRAAMHHGAKNSACKNTPPVKCVTRKTSDNASIPAFLPGSGVSVMSPGGAVIDPRPPVDLQMAASAGGFVHSVGVLLREGDRKWMRSPKSLAANGMRAAFRRPSG